MRNELAGQGLGFLGPSALRSQRLPLSRAIRGDQNVATEPLRAKLRYWLSSHEDHLISEENILGTTSRGEMFGGDDVLYPGAEDRLARTLELLGKPEVELFLAIRDPATFVTSAYGQQLRSGALVDVSTYVRGVKVRSLDWPGLIERLLGCEGVSRVVCWRLEDHTQVRGRVLARLLGPERAALVPPATLRHRGVSEKAYRYFMKTALEDMDTPVQTLLRDAQKRHPRLEGEPSMRLLHYRTYKSSLVNYDAQAGRIAGMERVEFLRPQNPPVPPV